MDQLSGWLDINSATGEWSVHEQPMVLVPRHFFVGIQQACEARFGVATMQEVMHEATVKGAKIWCVREAKALGISGRAVFERYLSEVTRRGMGHFTIEQLEAGNAVIRLDRSAIASEYPQNSNRKVCYSFASAIAGGLAYMLEQQNLSRPVEVRETQCLAAGDSCCRFFANAPDSRRA